MRTGKIVDENDKFLAKVVDLNLDTPKVDQIHTGTLGKPGDKIPGLSSQSGRIVVENEMQALQVIGADATKCALDSGEIFEFTPTNSQGTKIEITDVIMKDGVN